MTRRTVHCLGLTVLTWLQIAVRITEALAAAGHSDSFLVNLASSAYHPRQSRQVSYTSSNPSSSSSVYPVDYSSNGISRSLYPNYYTGYPVYPHQSGIGYSVPNGAQQLSRSYSPSYSAAGTNINSYSAYNSPSYPSSYNTAQSSSNNAGAALASRSLYPQASARANAPYGYYPASNNYYPNNRRNIGNVVLSYRSADPSEPEDPADDGNTRNQFAALPQPMVPRFQAQPQAVEPVANAATFTGVASHISQLPASQLAAFSGRGLGGGSTSGYGVGNSYASSVPAGATQTAAGGSDYAQSSPNTVSGSLYNPNYAKPTFYGKSAGGYGGNGGGGGGYSPSLLYPFFLYYPVQYGYDQGEQSVMPTGGYFPLIGYKRRYGYRSGPYYGYGIYVDYPPYFGFGKVKDGFGSDPEADAMAAVALEQGSGASESLNSGAGAASGYGQPGSSGYGNNGQSGYGGTTGGSVYGAARTANGYAAPVAGYNAGTGSNPSTYAGMGLTSNPPAGSQYPSQRSLSLPSGYTAVSSQAGSQSLQQPSLTYNAASRSYIQASPSASSTNSQSALPYRSPTNTASQYGTVLSTSG